MNKRTIWLLTAAILSLPFAAHAQVYVDPPPVRVDPAPAPAPVYVDPAPHDRVIERSHSILRSAWDNSITVNPIDLFTGNINIEYERAVASRVGVYGGLNFMVMRGVLLPSDTAKRLAIGPELGLRIYLLGRAPGGLWLGPYVNAAYVREDYAGTSYARDNLALGAGGMAGINLLFGQFNLSLGAGAGYQDYGLLTTTQRVANSYGVTPRLRLAVGAVF